MVDLNQCQNIYYGGCQKDGVQEAKKNHCKSAWNGYKACSGKDFQQFFNGEL
jgi:hypothetical protein